MMTLIIHAPHNEAVANDKRSFEGTVSSGVGNGFAIWRSIHDQLSPGDRVVVICKRRKEQAVAALRELVPTEYTRSGIQRYDVVVDQFVLEPYTHANTPLNRNGVALLPPSPPVTQRPP